MGCGCKKSKKSDNKKLNELLKKRLRTIITNTPQISGALTTKKK